MAPGPQIINRYFKLTDLQQEQFSRLPELYLEWNNKINVVSRKDIDLLMERHVLHSLAIAKFIEFRHGISVLDVGTGGGFPGIPLAIFYPDIQFTLVDSIGKKITVVNEVASALGLKNVKAFKARAEEVDSKFDFVVSRAVAPFPEVYSWVKGKFKNRSGNGLVCLKGGDLTEELKPFSAKIKEWSISSVFQEPFFETKKVVYLPVF